MTEKAAPATQRMVAPRILGLAPLDFPTAPAAPDQTGSCDRWMLEHQTARLLEEAGGGIVAADASVASVAGVASVASVAGVAGDADIAAGGAGAATGEPKLTVGADEPKLAEAVGRRGEDVSDRDLGFDGRPLPAVYDLGTVFPPTKLLCWHCGLPGRAGRPTVPVPVRIQRGAVLRVTTSGGCCSFPCAAARLYQLAGGGTEGNYSRDTFMRYEENLRLVYYSYTETPHPEPFRRARPPQKTLATYGGEMTPAQYAAATAALDPYVAWSKTYSHWEGGVADDDAADDPTPSPAQQATATEKGRQLLRTILLAAERRDSGGAQ